MVDERIAEAVRHGGGKFLAVIAVQRQNRNDLIVKHSVHERMYGLVVHAVADNVKTREVCAEDEARVRAVEDADLALFIRRHIWNDRDIQPCFFERQLLLQFLRSFDIPDTKNFADVEKRILVAILLREPPDFLRVANSAGNNPVD